MTTQPPPGTTTPTAVVTLPTQSVRPALRTATALILVGIVAEYTVTDFHPAHEPPNDHHAVFAEYAASDSWIAVHLGQFAAGMLIIVGILGLFRALRPVGGSTLLTGAGEAAAVLTASVLAMLQAVDGVALKHAVDSLVDAPAALQDAAFHDAEIVRWTEWAMAGYYRIAFGLTAVLIGAAVVRARVLPRWTAGPAVLSGVAFVLDGVNVSYHGFAGANLPNLISLTSFVLFAVTATVAAWWPVTNRSGGMDVAADTP
jgi:hypothetical protein